MLLVAKNPSKISASPSPAGNVPQYAGLKAIEFGATILSLPDSQGTILSTSGTTPSDVSYFADVKVKRK